MPMLYIHQTACISSQQTFEDPSIDQLHESASNKLHVIEPDNPGIAGIIMGTANGGMEDCIKFLNQIIEYEEGMLAPGNFVQSTPNAIASQVSLLTADKHYNITHVHRGLAFENAIIDADMLTRENPAQTYLLGAVDEISTYNYNIDYLDGWYKKDPVSNTELYASRTPASIAGEAAVMILVSAAKKNALVALQDIYT